MPTKIEWTQETWNPVTGCTPISEGCANCYAARMAKRLQAMGHPKYANGFKVTTHPQTLTEPLHWRKSRMIFVPSMGDLFHPEVPFEFVDRVCAVISLCPQHTFQVLTKRPGRMEEYFAAGRTVKFAGPQEMQSTLSRQETIAMAARAYGAKHAKQAASVEFYDWPLPNLHLGVTAELRKHLGRVFPLAKCPAAAYFISAEPLLGDLSDIGPYLRLLIRAANGDPKRVGLIVGGETGPGARPMKPDWPRSLRDQCQSAGVPFFFKQWGDALWLSCATRMGPSWPARYDAVSADGREWKRVGLTRCLNGIVVGKKKAGRLLDGKIHDALPTSLEAQAVGSRLKAVGRRTK